MSGFTPCRAGFAPYDGSLFFVSNGNVLTELNGIQQDPANPDIWYFCSQGQVQQYSGLAEYDGEWFSLIDGKLDTSYSGLVAYDGSRFMVAKGRLIREANGLIQDPVSPEDWYYIAEGQVQTQYTDLAYYDGAWFYLENGKIDFSFQGEVEYDKNTVRKPRADKVVRG